ncbi:MAG: hypothetical protein R3F30_12885 [Planctomycetota bacterium]
MTTLQTLTEWLDPRRDLDEQTRRALEEALDLIERQLLISGICYAIIGGWCLWVCWRGMVKKESFLVPSGLLLLLVGLPFLFMAAYLISIGWNPLNSWPALVVLGLMTWFLAFVLGHRVGFGVTDRSMRDAIVAGAKEMRMACEESFSTISFPTRSMDLQVAVHSWLGVSFLRFRRRNRQLSIRSLIHSIDRNLRLGPGDRTTVVFWLHLALAVLCLTYIGLAIYTRLTI